MRYLDLADFLLIASATLGRSVDEILAMADLGLAESAIASPSASFGGEELYPELPAKAAILLERLARNHPLLDGNKRVAFVCTIEFLERNGWGLGDLIGDDKGEATKEFVVTVAAGEANHEDITEWIDSRLTPSAVFSCAMCGTDLTGRGVVLIEEYVPAANAWLDTWPAPELLLALDDGRAVAVLHPNCWHGLFDELFRQEESFFGSLVIGTVEDIYAGLLLGEE